MAANTYTAIMQSIYDALEIVNREPLGFINGGVYKNSKADMVGVGQTIKYPTVPSFGAANDNTPAAYAPDATGRTYGNGEIQLTQSKNHRFSVNGEEQLSLAANAMNVPVQTLTFAEAFRAHCNTIENYVSTVAYKGACKAVGTSGTTPFASNTDLIADARQIIQENGGSLANLRVVVDPSAETKLLKLDILKKANESGDDMYRTGLLGNLYGFQVRTSANVARHTSGAATGYLVNNSSNEAAGQTTITLDTGTDAILAGDVIVNAETGRDATQYMVSTGRTGAGDIVIAQPGLATQWTNNDAITVTASYRANLAFDMNAVHLVTRVPMMPEGGDQANWVETIVDPVSGLAFQIAEYGQYRQRMIEVAIVYDAAVVNTKAVVVIKG